jgi:hypothetical protein
MLTGSLVSSLQGEPRSTHDIDFVVLVNQESSGGLYGALGRIGGYLEQASIERAIEHKSVFNLIDPELGIKVDFWLLTDEPFDRSRWARRRQESLVGLQIWISAPEDTILAKLRWAHLAGGSEKHLADAIRVYELQYPTLDRQYLDRWVDALDIDELWRQLLSRAMPLE